MRYLEPFRGAQVTVDQKVKSLRELTKDNVNQQRRLDILEPLIAGNEGKFAVMQQIIDLRKDNTKGFEAAQKFIRTDKGRQVMDEIRKTIAEMAAKKTRC